MSFLILTPGPEPSVRRDAVVSPCGRYRYSLTRSWSQGPRVLFIMLNPSTADAEYDDPTIRRCVSFSRAWGCGALEVVNLYAYRATDPEALKRAVRAGMDVGDGEDSDRHIEQGARRAEKIVLGWGAHVSGERMLGRASRVVMLLEHRELLCLGRSRDGQPRHPLMLPATSELAPFSSEPRS